MMKKIFNRSRLGRSQSKGRVNVETAFVSQTQSSVEDLDEVDRLANHPVLRPQDHHGDPRLYSLRKSRSETGGSIDRFNSSGSNQSSPMQTGQGSSASGFGSRFMGVHMLRSAKRGKKKPVSKMKRSYTVDFAAAQAEDSPKDISCSAMKKVAASGADQDPIEENEDFDLDDYHEAPVRRSSNHLVTAIIESRKDLNSSSPELTPPLQLKKGPCSVMLEGTDDIITISEECSHIMDTTMTANASAASNKTPPNSAPLPAKFSGLTQAPSAALPHNLLRVQLEKKCLIDCDTSSAASTTSPIMQNSLTKPSCLTAGSKEFKKPDMKLVLPLAKQRLILGDSCQDFDSSSSDNGTPKKLNPKISSPSVVKGKPNAPLLGRKIAGKRFLNLNAESESCSSAMSSMESVRSSTNSVASSSGESGAGMSSYTSSQSNSNLSLPQNVKPTLPELRRSNILSSSKFQVLSPISDKSQEQSSEQGDQGSTSRTPKISPTDHILTSCCGVQNDDTDNNNLEYEQKHQQLVLHQQEPAPFSMPKLQRRLALKQQQQFYQTSLLKKANAGIQGSDSGISMTSQDVQDMVELLKLPFDMPKLRRKTQTILHHQRPQSLPTRNTTFNNAHQAALQQLACKPSKSSPNSNSEICPDSWPGPKPGQESTLSGKPDNYHYHQICDNISGNAGLLPDETDSQQHESKAPPDPPPAFADENNRFYLTEDDMASEQPKLSLSNSASVLSGDACAVPAPVGNLSMRRRRTQMTLSFNIDPKQKTLMFTTDDAFHLNDCQEIDASLPLERQEWYHGGISKSEAENSLRSQDEGAYLVRNVDLRRQEFSLILKSAKGFMHMRIKRDANSRQFMLSDFPRTFLTIPDMVHHYTRNRLPINNAEHMCLKKPVAIQLL